MTDYDWDFAFGDLGNPLADIADWMLPPFPAWYPQLKEEEHGATRSGAYTKSYGCVAR